MENAHVIRQILPASGLLNAVWMRPGKKQSKRGSWADLRSASNRMSVSDSEPVGAKAETGAERMTELLCVLKLSRDEAAFGELFRYYAPRLKSYMRKLGAAEDMAEELAQEAMAMVWRKAHLFDPDKAGAGTWIFSIARNLRIDALRRRKRPEIELDDPTLVPDDPRSPEAELDHGQQAQAVRAALETLPREQATIVRLSFFEDKPHAEIAVQLGIPLGTVKSRMRLAFQRFRKALGEPDS
jgi:RNA polymerase sigma-70 factor (ECF subfamily)